MNPSLFLSEVIIYKTHFPSPYQQKTNKPSQLPSLFYSIALHSLGPQVLLELTNIARILAVPSAIVLWHGPDRSFTNRTLNEQVDVLATGLSQMQNSGGGEGSSSFGSEVEMKRYTIHFFLIAISLYTFAVRLDLY